MKTKKMRTIRQTLAMFLVAMMLLGNLSVTAFAAETDGTETTSETTETTAATSETTETTDATSEAAEPAGEASTEPAGDDGTDADAPDSGEDAAEPSGDSGEDAAEPSEDGDASGAAGDDGTDADVPDGGEDAAAPSEDGGTAGIPEDGFDMADTQRPDATEDVTVDIGTAGDKDVEDKDWDIVYDPVNDVYKVTFNIGSDAEATHQAIDLTKALEVLNQYAQTGKKELEDAIAALEKPAMGEPEMEKPQAPGVPENLDENMDAAYNEILADVPRDPEGEPDQGFDYAAVIAEKTGLSKDDPFVQASASRMYDQAMVDWVMDSWDKWEAEGHMYVNYFGDKDTMLYYGCGITVKWPDGTNKGTPVLKGEAPKFEVDTESEDYQAYLKELEAYNAELKALEEKYADDQAAYDKAVADLKAEFDRRVGADLLEPGDVKKFELFLTSDSKHTYKYQNGSFTLATPDWDKFVAGLKELWENDPEQYKRLYLMPDGEHWMFDPNKLDNKNETIAGFDGQILPDKYVDNNRYYVTQRCDAIYDLLTKVGGYDDYDALNRSPNITATNAIKAYLRETYGTDDVDAGLNAYILDYYNGKEGTSYASIDELVKGSEYARSELTNTETSGNRWFRLDNQNFVVDAHLETVKYDNFYQQLFSFAFGDENGVVGVKDENGNPVSFDEFLGEMKFNPDTNRWEYGNRSWTDNGYQNALYYYMSHQEIWGETDRYFQTLLANGLSADQATWGSLMMAFNIDGVLTGNDWQDTAWPWYSSITLDRTDYGFKLNKTDEDGNPITVSPAEFQLWYVGADGNPVYLKQGVDEDGEPIFIETSEPSYITTGDAGSLEGLYSLMKDKTYYLKETKAPEGYQVDPNVYVLGTGIDTEYLENVRNEAIADLNSQLDSLKDDAYKAGEAALAEIEAEVKALMEADGMSAMDVAAYANELKARIAALKADGMGIADLEKAIEDAKSGFDAAKAVLDQKAAALEAKRDAAAAEIGRLNGELDAVRSEFDGLKARYDASTDIAERNALIDQMSALQARAESIAANMSAVKSGYEADAAHAEYAAALAEAEGRKGAHDAYAGALSGIMASDEYKSLKDRVDAVRGLQAAKAALDGHVNSAAIKLIEQQLKIESDRLFKEIGELQADPDTDWMGTLDLEVYLENRKAIEEGAIEIPALPEAAGTVDVGSIDASVPDYDAPEFDIPEPETPLDPGPDPEDPPEEPDPEDPDPDDPDIPEPEVPLDPGPEEPETPEEEIPEEDVPLTDIPEEDVPLTDIPEEEIPEEDIPEEDIPLSDIPQTGDESHAGFFAAMMALSAVGLAGLAVTGRKREEI